jgi:hypothetical protein
MADLLAQYGELFYHRFEIRMIATADVVFDAWTIAHPTLYVLTKKLKTQLSNFTMLKLITAMISVWTKSIS